MSEEKKEVKINSMEENYKDLQALIECLNIDFDKFQKKKVKAAGQRARNSLLNCKKLCDTLRKQIIAEIKAIPIKHRIQESGDDETEEKDEAPPSPPKLVRQTGANGPHETHQPKPEPAKPKKKRTRKANKKKITKADLKDD